MPAKPKPTYEERVKKLIRNIHEANKDPQFRKAVKAFIAYHTGKPASESN